MDSREVRQKRAFEAVMILKARHGLIYSEKEIESGEWVNPKKLYPGDPLPPDFDNYRIPMFRAMNRRERRAR